MTEVVVFFSESVHVLRFSIKIVHTRTVLSTNANFISVRSYITPHFI